MSNEPNSFLHDTQQHRTTLAGEFFAMLMENKKWWLLPILLIFLALAALVMLSSTGAAPFIYTLF